MATVTDLPNEFDIIVVGTGLTEAIVAAAFSRIGLKVLHLDRNDYYGGSYANFNLQAIDTWKQKNEEVIFGDYINIPQSLAEGRAALPESAVTTDTHNLLTEGEKVIALPPEPAHAFNIKTQFHIRERTEQEEAVAASKRTRSRFLTPPLTRPLTPPLKLPQDTEPNQTEIQSDSNGEKSEEKHSAGEQGPEDKLQKDTAEIGQVEVHGREPELGEVGAGDGLVGPASSGDGKPDEACRDGAPVEEGALSRDGAQSVLVPESGAETVVEPLKLDESLQGQEWTVGDMKDDWRRFCLDLSPKVLYSSGDTVELLIQSDVSRYCEFRTVSRVLTLLNGSLQQVPCSRADVFSSKSVSLIEKRLMMKFLQFAADYENSPAEYQDYSGKPFVDFLKSKRLTPNVQHYVQHAIAMVTDTATTVEGLKSTQMFLRSLGRYGNTAFLFPLYGTGELPQAFARLSAVFGGVYCLQMSPTHIVADSDNKCCGIIASNGQLIRCKYLIAETSYLPPTFVCALSNRKTSRAVYVTDSSILPSVEAELSLLNLTCKDDPSRPVTVLELPASACVCPQNMFVVHMTRIAAHSNPEEDFSEATEILFSAGTSGNDGDKPKVLWSVYFSQEDRSQMALSDAAVQNVLVVSAGGDVGVGLDFCVDEAKCIFQTVCPDEEFLPKPPNPEDIIHVDDTETTVATGPSEYEAKDEQVGDTAAAGATGPSECEAKDEQLDIGEKDPENGHDDEGVAVVQKMIDEINIETGENSESRTG